jgi:hypothetical protein
MRSLREPRNLIIFAFVIMAIGVVAASWFNTSLSLLPSVEVNCYIGSEKDDFLDNPEVQRILQNRYQLSVDYRTAGSIEQAFLSSAQLADVDCLWPSNTSAEEIFKLEHPEISASSQVIFNSPIILYTWDDVFQGLTQSGIISDSGSGYATADMEQISDLMVTRPDWQTVNVDRINSFRIITTDPTQSNSGNMFYALFLNMLNDGQVASTDDLAVYIGDIEAYYNAQGLMENSSGDLFDQYVTQGAGAVPLMANYESLLIELTQANPDLVTLIQDNIRIAYPVPTVYSSHPLIALTDEGERLMEALQDPDIQRIAWEQHGFRSGVPGVVNDPAILEMVSLPPTNDITWILPLPRPQAMLEMVNELEN